MPNTKKTCLAILAMLFMHHENEIGGHNSEQGSRGKHLGNQQGQKWGIRPIPGSSGEACQPFLSPTLRLFMAGQNGDMVCD